MRFAKILPPLLVLLLLDLGGWRLAHYLAPQHRAFLSGEFTQAHPLLYRLGPDQPTAQNGYTLLTNDTLFKGRGRPQTSSPRSRSPSSSGWTCRTFR
ncbi:MAG: hypothetical protein JO250_16025 [Armatimonadetes bacterium]|nr:hypothetical protein [Armatimonadota bacterium]